MDTAQFHPVLIHIPIALSVLMPFLFCTLVYLTRGGQIYDRVWMVFWLSTLILLVTTAMSYWSGMDRAHYSMGDPSLIDAHKLASIWFTLVSALIFLSATVHQFVLPKRSRALDVFIVLLLVANCALVSRAGHLGGQLVYGQ